MKIKVPLILLIVINLFIFSNLGYGQVGQIEESIKENSSSNNSSSNNNSNSNNNNDSDSEFTSAIVFQLIGYLFNGLGTAIVEGQKEVLKQKDEFPEIISLETSICAGLYLEENGNILYPRIQGNWGLFSSEFRYTSISDLSGQMSTLDWQILKCSIPINPVRISGGLGFVNIPEFKSSYIESSVRADVWLWKRKVNTNVEFRSTGKMNQKRFRQEFNFQVDYKIKSYGRFHISPLIGIKYQSYLEQFEQTYFMVGCNFRIQ